MEHYTLPHRHNQSMSQLLSPLPNIEEFQTTADIFKQLSARIPQGRKRNILPCRRLEKNTNASSYDRKDHGYFLHKQRRINQNLTQIYRF